MNRILIAILTLLIIGVATPAGHAQQSLPPVLTPDPDAYAATVARQMQREGMQPIRATFEQMFATNGSALPANVEGFLVTWERYLGRREATIVKEVDDVVIGSVTRQIYYYHYLGGNAWLFTRFDFVRVGDNNWALSALSLEDQWFKIAQSTSALPPAK